MKKKYTPAEIEIMRVDEDIITMSGGIIDPDDPMFGGDETEGSSGNGIGGGYNPGGWT